MANEMNKQVEIEGRQFNVKVTLNHMAERRPGGIVTHRIVINDMGPSNWFYEQMATTERLTESILLCESKARDYVMGTVQLSPEEKILVDLGFK